ncbi:MAG: hypothetical protein HYX79_08615 [Chloroflexi bacterium]|nr:hypothetical protein [Chloroflexota bacterium]
MKLARIICSSILLLGGLLAVLHPGDALAQEPTKPPEPALTISNKFPTVEVTSGEKAVFQLELKYVGELNGDPKIFDLKVNGPKDWQFYITPQYPTDKKISSIQLSPGFSVGEQIQVNATPAYFLRPQPGDYKITLEASSQDGKITAKAELVTKITATYNLFVIPAGEKYNTTATAGKENVFSIKVVNGGSAPIRQLSFSADKPEEWLVTFEPQKLDSIASADTQTVDVKITPPARTIAGDYLITLKTSGTEASAEKLELRVTVETPTIWGWVGIAIVVVVIVGLVLTFRQLSRR